MRTFQVIVDGKDFGTIKASNIADANTAARWGYGPSASAHLLNAPVSVAARKAKRMADFKKQQEAAQP